MYLRMQEVPDLKRKTLQEFIDAYVEQGEESFRAAFL